MTDLAYAPSTWEEDMEDLCEQLVLSTGGRSGQVRSFLEGQGTDWWAQT